MWVWLANGGAQATAPVAVLNLVFREYDSVNDVHVLAQTEFTEATQNPAQAPLKAARARLDTWLSRYAAARTCNETLPTSRLTSPWMGHTASAWADTATTIFGIAT